MQKPGHRPRHLFQNGGILVQQQPLLRQWKVAGEIPDVRASAEFRDPRSSGAGRRSALPKRARARRSARRRLNGSRTPASQRAKDPSFSSRASTFSILSTASSHVGRRSRTRRAPAVIRSRTSASSRTDDKASSSAATFPGGTSRPASESDRESGIAPVPSRRPGRHARVLRRRPSRTNSCSEACTKTSGRVVERRKLRRTDLADRAQPVPRVVRHSQLGGHERPWLDRDRGCRRQTSGATRAGSGARARAAGFVSLSGVIAATESRWRGLREPRASGAQSVPGSTTAICSGLTPVRLERPHSRRSRDNARSCGRQRPPFALLEPVGLLTTDAEVSGKRQVDERDEVEAPTFAFHLRRHRAERETVDEDEGTVRNRRERLRRGLERRRGWPRKGAGDLRGRRQPSRVPVDLPRCGGRTHTRRIAVDRPWNDDRDPPHTLVRRTTPTRRAIRAASPAGSRFRWRRPEIASRHRGDHARRRPRAPETRSSCSALERRLLVEIAVVEARRAPRSTHRSRGRCRRRCRRRRARGGGTRHRRHRWRRAGAGPGRTPRP